MVVILGLLCFGTAMYVVHKVDQHFNPAGFDLGMQYKLQENDMLAKKGLEIWKQDNLEPTKR